MSRGNVNFQRVIVRSAVYWCCQQKSSTVDLVYYTYDGRARRGWMHKVYYTLVTATKKIADWINKNWLPRQRPLSDRNPISQQSSTPITLYQLRKFRDDRSRTCWNNWARTSSKNRKYFRHLEVTRSLKMTRANTCDFYSTSKATVTPTCISFVSFIYSQTSVIPASS